MQQPLGLRWRDELLPLVDGKGRTLGSVERGVARVLGLRTFAVHLSGRSADGRFWVQQRAFDKATDPGRWDTLMGGQMAAGESIEATLERETAEEAGLGLADLTALARGPDVAVRRPVVEGYMDERIAVFRAVLAEGVLPVESRWRGGAVRLPGGSGAAPAPGRGRIHPRSHAHPRRRARARRAGRALAGGCFGLRATASRTAASSASGASPISAWPVGKVTTRARSASASAEACFGQVIWSRAPSTSVVGQAHARRRLEAAAIAIADPEVGEEQVGLALRRPAAGASARGRPPCSQVPGPG